MKKVLLIHTGGTISMNADATGSVSPSTINPLLNATHYLNSLAEITQEDIFHVPSPHITLDNMLVLSKRVDTAVSQGFDAVVITHGTDTLEETAYFLDLTNTHDIPVVVTGAMRSSNELGSDGLTNLHGALLVAVCDESRHKGTLVVMNDEIHTAKYVTKTHTTNLATFQTPTFGPIGLISKNQVLYFQTLSHHESFAVDKLSKKKIYVLKAYADMDDLLISYLSQQQVDGVVIEALGAGNLPPATLDGLQQLLDKHIPVVLVSRAFNGVTQDVYDYLGGGKQLKQAGVIFTTGLSGQKARIKLVVLLNTVLNHPLDTYFNHS